ncbi:sigma-70 family RNA polymerase sigma factor [Pseudooceanicola sp. HF7]|uniref:sigma-70 family RNA polymerase sigma factor n=1 Tax=Pseudooceanicola sp. HF7 TaxID=2721560 RepID=UPI001431D687|nr:sigma-70 family RNA polymerase sigma factor [Pseudooceanicola sp. HF7]NIZ09160.1 sigma-70 family RNA polymerase sigma factor [Pseudooceanicola sp. HF7]
MATLEDIEHLIARTALADRSAFQELYQLTSAKLFGVALRVLGTRTEAEEAIQETYIKIWRGAGRYNAGGYSPMTWLITIARNTAIDRLRARRAGGAELAEAEDIASSDPTPEAAAIAGSERALLLGCLEELPEDRAEAVQGAYLMGLTYQELADRFGVPINTMRSWLRRSLLKLRECLTR